MMKFCALNESSLSDDDGDPELATREAQEEEAYSLYHQALHKQSDGNLEEAEKMFKEILEMEFLNQILPNDEKKEAPLRPPVTLKYLLYKNLAAISNKKKDFSSAVEFYLEALEIDSTDVIMWYQMGNASLKIFNYPLARLCFEEGLKCNPNHWLCMDNIITVTHTLNDYASCLYYIAKALEKECYYLKGLAFMDAIYKEDPSLKSFCESYFDKCSPSIHYTDYDKEEAQKLIQESLDMRENKRAFNKSTPLPVLTLVQPIKESTWKSVGDSLVNMYDVVSQATPSVSFSCKIDLSQYAENTNKNVDMVSEKLASPSPMSSLSEACSSSSTSRCNGLQSTQKSDGLLQLDAESATNNLLQNSFIDPSCTEMQIDDVNRTCNSDPLQNNSYTLLLPQVDTPTDLSICNDSTSNNRRTSKRKRLLTELSDFSSKRRSTRVRNPALRKPHDNVNYQELLQKFLPSKLIGDCKFEDQDEDSETLSLDKGSDHTLGQSSENDKSDKTLNIDLISSEKNDVSEFLTSNQSNGGIIDLLYKYVTTLGKKSYLMWPKNLIDAFCSAFIRLRKHITVPNIFSHSTELCDIKEVGLAVLTYCEFKVDKWYLDTGHSAPFSTKGSPHNSVYQNGSENIGNDFHSDMEFLVQVTVRRDAFLDDWLNFSIRALWLKAKFHSMEGEIDLAVLCMAKLGDVFNDQVEVPTKITVRNCSISTIITADKVQQQLESLQRCQSLEEVQRLYEHKDYAAVVDLLILSFNQPRTKRKQSLDGVPERHAQLMLLQNSLLNLERYKECIYWSEVSFNEALQQFMNAARSDWSETMAHLLKGLDKCAKINPEYLADLDEAKLVRLTQNLILVIVIQMENYDFSADNASLLVVLPWIILYRLILNEEKRKARRSSSKASENGSSANLSCKASVNNFLSDFDLSSKMPSSLMLLFTAHEYLGRRSWCTAADGLLLLHCIEVMMADLQNSSGNSYLYREELETGLEQCIYCLYGHPHKRTRAKHLQEHNAKQIPLTWEKAATIFQYFKPTILPEFDSYRTSTVSAELESLLKRITVLVPPDEDPTALVDNYTSYIEGVTDKCPDSPFGKRKPSPLLKDLYYLLGDYYFKNKEFSKAIRLYLEDICINPDRQDSWAGMALSRSSQLDQKLNSYELRNESTIYRKSSAALRCFEHALELDPTTTSLWIEYGSLAYILHSHASRQLKQDVMCKELEELLLKKKSEMLLTAKKCFKAANHCDDGGEPEEAWLHHYMLGKISEKEGLGPPVYLNHYQKALMYLHEDFARYPQKIQYHNPLELAIEALEVYYRLHASCLKYLWKHESCGTDLETLRLMKQYLNEIKESPFAHYQEKCKKEISSSPSSESEEYVVTPVALEAKKIMDHNYSGNANTIPKKISENSERRCSRPSTDSSPEAYDSAPIQEVVDSLVGIVAERFVDEELEKAEIQKNLIKNVGIPSSQLKHDNAKIVIELVGEESVYTTDQHSVPMEIQENYSNYDIDSKKVLDETEQARVNKEKEELAKMQALAMELETEAAASKLVEEMNLQNNEKEEYDYSMYSMYDQKHIQEDSTYYSSLNFCDENQKIEAMNEEVNDNSTLLADENATAVQSLLRETMQIDEPMIDETERAVQSLLSENERAVQSLLEENERDMQTMLSQEAQKITSEEEKAVLSILGKEINSNLLVEHEKGRTLGIVSFENEKNIASINEGDKNSPLTTSSRSSFTQLISEKESLQLSSGVEKISCSSPIKDIVTSSLSSAYQIASESSDIKSKDVKSLVSERMEFSQIHKTENVKIDVPPCQENENRMQISNSKKEPEVSPVVEFLIENVEKCDKSGKAEITEKMEITEMENSLKSILSSDKSVIKSVVTVINSSSNLKKNIEDSSTEKIKNTSLQTNENNNTQQDKQGILNVMNNSEAEIENKASSSNKECAKACTSETSKESSAKKSKSRLPDNASLGMDTESDKDKKRRAGKGFNESSKKGGSSSNSSESHKSNSKKKSTGTSVIPQPKKKPSAEELLQSQAEISKLIGMCLDSMREVLQRFIQHYKALYRMAHYYCHSTRNKNLQWAREILLAATPATKNYPSMPGLFADRKNANFFNGIWRAPSNEIDRPGSFGAHMYRSVHLLIQVLTEQKDYNMLVNLTQQLYRTPDLGKKYMRDTDRVFLVREAYDCCVTILRDQLNSLLQEEPPPEESRLICCLLEIYRSCQTLLKAGINVEETNDLLEEAYTMYRIGEVDPHPSVLEQATKFCQLQLGKSYPDGYNSNRSSKYLSSSDMSDTSMVHSPDAWQKEFSKSLVMPGISCESRNKIELKAAQDPVILIPIDPKFNNLVPNTGITQRPGNSPQMVHVEKPKAENLQACSVAFLPVAPVYSKEASNHPNALPTTSLLSCQAFECFDVLTSLMQASGYKVAHQPSSMIPSDSASTMNLQKNKSNSKEISQNFRYKTTLAQQKPTIEKPKRRKRKSITQKMEGLNLCKRISTRPIVSSSIANSIAEIKVPTIVSNTKKSTHDGKKYLPTMHVNVNDQSNLAHKITEFSGERSVIVKNMSPAAPANDKRREDSNLKGILTDDCQPICLVKRSDTTNTHQEPIDKKNEPCFLENNDDSSLSANLEASIIEKCAKEMLEFINKKVEDTVLNTKFPGDSSRSLDETIKLASESIIAESGYFDRVVKEQPSEMIDNEKISLEAKQEQQFQTIEIEKLDVKSLEVEKNQSCTIAESRDDTSENRNPIVENNQALSTEIIQKESDVIKSTPTFENKENPKNQSDEKGIQIALEMKERFEINTHNKCADTTDNNESNEQEFSLGTAENDENSNTVENAEMCGSIENSEKVEDDINKNLKVEENVSDSIGDDNSKTMDADSKEE